MVILSGKSNFYVYARSFFSRQSCEERVEVVCGRIIWKKIAIFTDIEV